MARKSKADFESTVITPMMPGRGRPEPPAELSPVEARIWRDVVDGLPAHWVGLAEQAILRRAVAQAAAAERYERQMREMVATGRDNGKDFDEIAASHARASKTLMHLLGCLRATPRARSRDRLVDVEIDTTAAPPPANLPWNTRARTNGHRKTQ
jgi:hypothetical protein